MPEQLVNVIFDTQKTVALCAEELNDGMFWYDPPLDALSDPIMQQRCEYMITALYAEGYNTFICGMAEGFDLMAASTLLSLKRHRGLDIQLIAITTPAERDRLYPAPYAQLYVDFLESADGSICLYSDSHLDAPFFARIKKNNALLDNSSVLITYYEGRTLKPNSILSRAMFHKKTIYNLCVTPIGQRFSRNPDKQLINGLSNIK